jgi:beta-glucosidase
VRNGKLKESVIDEAARRILRAKFALGLFEHPYTDETRAKKTLLTPEHRHTARQVAQKSIVLLKNEKNILPLSKSIGTLAVIGPLADSKEDMLGSWAAHGKAEEAVSILTGIRESVSSQTKVLPGKDEDAVAIAKQADAVVLVLGEKGEMSGEANSRAFLDLPGNQQQLLEAVAATGKPLVLVVMSGRPLAITWAAEHVPAILWTWFPGTEGGRAVADILFGDVNPSAKLPVTIPRSVGQVPIYYNALPTGRPAKPDDRYTSKYIDSPNEPLFPFGHGLSYTKFEYSDLRVSVAERITISATVRNSGSRAGDEIVQLYVNDPVASTSRPVRELKGFQRITLAPVCSIPT